MMRGSNSVQLPSTSLNLMWGRITLSHGCIQNLSTFYTDVKVIYHSSRRTIELQIPLNFDVLMFTYDYNLSMFPVHTNGEIKGILEDFKINIILSFDITGYKAHIDKVDIRDSWKISIVTGNNLLDWIISVRMSGLKSVITNKVKDFLESVIIDAINKEIPDVRSLSAFRLEEPQNYKRLDINPYHAFRLEEPQNYKRLDINPYHRLVLKLRYYLIIIFLVIIVISCSLLFWALCDTIYSYGLIFQSTVHL